MMSFRDRLPPALAVRLPVLLGLLLLAMVFAYGYGRHGGTKGGWRELRVQLMSFGPWEDVQTVTYSIDCRKQGVDPYQVNCDPGHRPLNYPPVWLELGRFGVTGQRTAAVGWVLVALSAAGCAIALVARTRFSVICVVLCLLGLRPLLLAMERANTDQAIFFLLVAACAAIPRLPAGVRQWFRAGTVVFLTCLKVYPIAAAIMLLKARRSVWAVLATVVAAVAALVLSAGRALHSVVSGTPTLPSSSFGILPLLYAAGQVLRLPLGRWAEGHRLGSSALALLLFAASVATGLWMRRRMEWSLPFPGDDGFRGTLALACAAIYCFAFAGGSSFNYRLLFLTGVLAFLLEEHDRGRLSVRVYPVLLLLYLVIPGRFVVVHEAFDLLTFCVLSAWIGVFVVQRLGTARALAG